MGLHLSSLRRRRMCSSERHLGVVENMEIASETHARSSFGEACGVLGEKFATLRVVLLSAIWGDACGVVSSILE